ncbi:hypothetical protein OV079_24230 [Nannocystis pusilla]|uniref:Uncharacterized protein n=1 Tax=Nannocystis pusilla TaxID=889268 RepID=A0A9X3EZM5_9BACT|nr:hypothetical protein [Nannocystis pusilla]MCY1008613.1 hypothetical protein [Nannocystis pusilla]
MPTIWFWNNWDAQRLLLPFVLLFAVPAFLVCDALRMWAGLDTWVSLVPSLLIFCLTMGLVERRVRKRARLRCAPDIAEARPTVTLRAQESEQGERWAKSVRRESRVPPTPRKDGGARSLGEAAERLDL